MDLRQIHRKTCLVPRSDEFEYQGHRSTSPGTKRAVPITPPQLRRNGTHSLQITSISSRRDHFVAAGGDFGGLRAVYIW